MTSELPNHVPVERQILRDALADIDTAKAYADQYALDDEHFYDPANRSIWAVLRHHLATAEGPLDAHVLHAILAAHPDLIASGTDPERVHATLADILDLAPVGGNAEHANLLIDVAARRRIIAAAQASIAAAQTRDQLPADIVARGAAMLAEADLRAAGTEGIDMQSALAAGLDEWETIKRRRYIPTGITGLDALIGGLEQGRLVTGAGRPGMGKSVLGLHFSRRFVTDTDRHILHFSLEMPALELAARYASATGAASFAALTGKDAEAHARIDWSRLFALADDTANARLHILEKSDARTVADIDRITRRHNAATGPVGLVVVDYVGLLVSDDARVVNRVQQVGRITNALKELATGLDIPVVALAQLNREVEKRMNKVPILSDLRESGDVEQDSDQVIFVHRPEVYDPLDRPGDADLIVEKNRAGKKGTATVVFDGRHVRFTPKHGPSGPTGADYYANIPKPNVS